MADPDHVKEHLEAVRRHLGAEHYHTTRQPTHEAPNPVPSVAEPAEPGAASVAVGSPPLWARKVLVHGRTAWVLEDDAGILEVADSLDTLTADHPHATITPSSDPE